MFAVVAFLFLILTISITVVMIVALPQLRSGKEIFTPDGKEAMVRVTRRATDAPVVTTMVGRPRPVPEGSGPIPEVPERVIDLRPDPGRSSGQASGQDVTGPTTGTRRGP